MKKEDLRIVYVDTPGFVAESPRALVEDGYNAIGVITVPDKPVGRHGSALQPSAVKRYAVSVGLPVSQPEKSKDEVFLEEPRISWVDLQIVVTFRMLPEVVRNMFRPGTFNLCASLLPQHRGTAPINWTVINDDTETGVIIFSLTHETDMGKITHQKHPPVADTDDIETVHDASMVMGAGLVIETVDLLLGGKIDAIPQEEFYKDAVELHPAPKTLKDTYHIDWNQPVKKIYDFVRGLSSYPAAWTELISADGKRMVLKAYRTKKRSAAHNFPVGSIHTDHKSYTDVAMRDGLLRLHSLQSAGKEWMNTTDFLNGFKQTAEHTVGR